ncbi:MAG: serine protease [Prosthecobacter sp.]|uniref:S1 family peptidase n=1 Tax=Prosthecobacter sp. TaxID=1965333 RepID=UPI0025DFCCAD|nr:serine protease [Prosthecobacter sp.]MCF7786853.1 serine protease [Prosthecobacter sp.]
MTIPLSHALLFALILPFAGASCAGRMNVPEKMMWSTYPLATFKGAATGFVINRRDSGAPGGKVPVIFTSVHVLETMGKGPLIIGFRILDAAGEARVALLAFIPPKPAGKKKFYVRHPDFDIAAFALHIPAEIAARADVPSCLNENSLSRDGKALHVGEEVSFLGYPDVLPGTDGAFPLLRSGRVASYPLGTAQAQGRFLINSDVYPGDSGAPVFINSTGTRPELVGMIIQRISPKASHFSHFAVAVDADVIRQTLALVQASENHMAPAPPSPSAKPSH